MSDGLQGDSVPGSRAGRDAERLRQILQGAVDHAIIEMDLDRTVRGWNAGAERLFGWTCDEVLGRPADILFPFEDRARGQPEREARQAVSEGRAEDTRWHVRKGENRFWASGSMSVLRDRAGEPEGLLKIVRDHSTARQAEEALLGALDAANRSNEARARVMAVAGHDLRQPLQVAAMALERLRPKVEDEKGAKHLGLALDALSRLGNDLERLATAATSDAGFGPVLTSFPVGAVLAQIAPTWRHHARAKGLRLRVVPSSATVRSDPAMLLTIVGNLVGNAIKYTERGGVVVGCRRDGTGHAALTVADTGVGIDPAMRNAVFDPGRQLDPTRDGLGLGLAIVRRTAAVLGHPVHVASEPGRGSRFSVVLPLAGRPDGAI